MTPAIDAPRVQVFIGDCRAVLRSLPADSVQACVTSPPYFGLRSYRGQPAVWGGAEECAHEWGEEEPGSNRGGSGTPTNKNGRGEGYGRDVAKGAFCRLCGAWRGQLGLEPRVEMYVEHLVEVFREVRRVLRPDGVAWCNLGDSFANDAKWGGATSGKHVTSLHGDTGIGRQKRLTGFKPKDLMMIPARVAIALQTDGWWIRQRIVWAKGLSFCPTYSGTSMPSCLAPETRVFVKRGGWVSRVTLADVLASETMPNILTDKGWKTILAAWKTTQDAVRLRAGKVESVICSPEHRFPVSSDRRRRVTRLESAGEVRHRGSGTYLLYATVGQFLGAPMLTHLHGLPLDDTLGFLVGVYAAEGGMETKAGTRVSLTIGAHELDFSERIRLSLKRVGQTWSEATHKNALRFRFSSEPMGRLLSLLVSGQVRTKGLAIEVLLNTPKSFRDGLLRGYIDGDGSPRPGGGWIAASASRRLRDDVATLASTLGLITSKGVSRQVDLRTGNKSTAWTVWTPYMTRRPTHTDTAGLFHVPPRQRHRLKGQREMIDLEVEGGTFLIGDGLVTHNSVQDRPSTSHEDIFILTREPDYFWDKEAVAEPAVSDHRSGNGYKREPNLTKRDKNGPRGNDSDWLPGGTRNLRSVWVINPEPYSDWEYDRESADFTYLGVPMKTTPGCPVHAPGEPLAEPEEDAENTDEHGLFGDRSKRPPGCRCVVSRLGHFAVWPSTLVATMVKASTSERGACRFCGAPWERVVRTRSENLSNAAKAGTDIVGKGHPSSQVRNGHDVRNGPTATSTTVGWRPTCVCRDQRGKTAPSAVLDPFLGSGTTALVSRDLGRRSVGIEQGAEYLPLIRRRLGRTSAHAQMTMEEAR